jgi:hypothetical protein
MKLVHNYLRICHTYCDFLGGLRWSQSEDAVDFAAGGTFLFAEEIAQFLEGFARDRLLHFAHVLHLLIFLRGPVTDSPDVSRLRGLFAFVKGGLRNAGAFFAHLCRDIPEEPGPLQGLQVCERLRNSQMPLRFHVLTASDKIFKIKLPSLGPQAFQERVLGRVHTLSLADLRQWLRDGCGPVVEAGETVAQRLPLPETLEGTLAALLERPRLALARSLVPQLVSALTLPRPHRTPQELALGGYADVITKGNFEQILPGQFALDELEFFRRYPEQELLYFHREEPHTRTQRDLVVVLDQGVRTWGEVRLVLAAAVVALGRQAVRGQMPFLLATTGDGQLVNPMEMKEELGELVEASDLSAEPGWLLERVLEQSSGRERDVVLLTHRRNLREENVAAAARRALAPLRLFAVALDGSGQAELAEVRHGHGVPVRRFRVDLGMLRNPPPEPAGGDLKGPLPWRGSVEPTGYPFRFGLTGSLIANKLAFDHEGQWLLTVSQGGMLHAWRTDDKSLEILPRGMTGGRVLVEPCAAVGVAGGFVVVGSQERQIVVVHYDFGTRSARTYELADRTLGQPTSAGCLYLPQHHALIIHPDKDQAGAALDLATGEWYGSRSGSAPPGARAAWLTYLKMKTRPNQTWVVNRPNIQPATQLPPYVWLDPARGQLAVDDGIHPPWPVFTPLADGRPILKGTQALEAQCRGATLALKITGPGDRNGAILYLFRGPKGAVQTARQMTLAKYAFTLSADGEYLAMQIGPGSVQLWPTAEQSRVVFSANESQYSETVKLYFRPQEIILYAGSNHHHIVNWSQGGLRLGYFRERHPDHSTGLSSSRTRVLFDRNQLVTSFPVTGHFSFIVERHPERFLEAVEWEGLIAVLDRFGQVTLLDRQCNLVCMVMAFRDQIGVWMPDGTRAGSVALIGGPPTPGALERIGRALQQATSEGATP